jgi:uncharacterized membrane protein
MAAIFYILLVGGTMLALVLTPVLLIGRIFSRLGAQGREIDRLNVRIGQLENWLKELASRERADAARTAAASRPVDRPGPSPAEPLRSPEPRPAVPTASDAPVPRAIPTPLPASPEPVLRRLGPDATFNADTAAAPVEAESLERWIGTHWLLYVGVAAIVIGIAYFEKLAFENHWIGETARVIQGAIAGAALIYAGSRFVRRGYGLYGQMLAGCGAAVLYVSTYAAFNFYHLIERPVAFALMVVITGFSAVLADRWQSQGLAVMAVGGGFVTPFLLPGTTDAQIALFGYDLILVAGTVYLARIRNWPLLNVISYVLTLVTIAGWADRFYTPEKFLRTEWFLTAFCAMFLYILRECSRSSSGPSQMAAFFLWTAPVAYYAASLLILFDHSTAFLVWLVALTLVGGVASTVAGALAGLVVWFGAAMPLLIWIDRYAGTEALLRPGLITVAGVYAIALASQLRSITEKDDVDPSCVAWLHVNGLLMFAGAYFLLEPIRVAITGAVAAAFAVWNGAFAAALFNRRREYALHFTALAFTMLSIAIALQFDGAAVTVGWAAEGAVILALGMHERRDWLRLGGVVLFSIAVVRALGSLFEPAPINQSIFFNPRALSTLFVIALCYVIAWLYSRDARVVASRIGLGSALIVAQVLSLALLTSEILAYWAGREAPLAEQMMISVTWAAYSTALIVIGLVRRYAPIRYFAMIMFAITTAKVFFVDLSELDRIYRVLSIIVLGVLLLVSSYLYQRARSLDASTAEAD